MMDWPLENWILGLQLFSTLAMVGLIWFVQVVHYPLFAKVGSAGFTEYEQLHQQRTTLVVAPLMLTEAATACAMLWARPDHVSLPAAIVGLALLALLWASTFFWQVPAHEKLSHEFDARIHQRLVRSNWLRTTAWTLRGLLVCWMLVP